MRPTRYTGDYTKAQEQKKILLYWFDIVYCSYNNYTHNKHLTDFIEPQKTAIKRRHVHVKTYFVRYFPKQVGKYTDCSK